MKKKKKKKKTVLCCYVQDLRKWVTVKEAVEYSIKGHSILMHHKIPVSESDNVPLIVDAIRQFLEEEGGFVTPVQHRQGWYVGLRTFLIGEGFNRDKLLTMTSGEMLRATSHAWQLYRRDHPFKISKFTERLDDPETSEGGRAKLFGFHVTAVLRWMGRDMWDYEEAKTALAKLGFTPAEPTIRIQLRAGKKGERGAPATLSDEEAGILYECLND